jgi:hypothetical protein
MQNPLIGYVLHNTMQQPRPGLLVHVLDPIGVYTYSPTKYGTQYNILDTPNLSLKASTAAKFLVGSSNIWCYMCFFDVSGENSAFIFRVTTHKTTWFTTQKPQCKETMSRSLEDSGRRSGTSQARRRVVMKVSVRKSSCLHNVLSLRCKEKKKVIPTLH